VLELRFAPKLDHLSFDGLSPSRRRQALALAWPKLQRDCRDSDSAQPCELARRWRESGVSARVLSSEGERSIGVEEPERRARLFEGMQMTNGRLNAELRADRLAAATVDRAAEPN
jgi:hypothetical protein